MKWPWRRTAGGTETRAGGYTDAIVNQIIARANGSTAAVAGATAALETAAGHVGRAFAAADVAGSPFSREVVTPAALMLIGRELIRNGETLLAIDANLRCLLPATSWDVEGAPDPQTWTYRATLASPSYTSTRTVPGAAVVHPRYAIEPARPWAGLGPITVASLAGKLSASVAAALTEESGTTTGFVLPLPVGGEDASVLALRSDLRKAGARCTLSSRCARCTGPVRQCAGARLATAATRPGPAGRRSGAVHRGRKRGARRLRGSGRHGRERGRGRRSAGILSTFLHATIGPLARLVEAELRTKLDDPDLGLSFDSLFAGDLAGRARAFQSLVGGGMDVDKAAGLAGLMESE